MNLEEWRKASLYNPAFYDLRAFLTLEDSSYMEPEYLKNYWPVGSPERTAYMWRLEYENMTDGADAWVKFKNDRIARLSITNTSTQFFGDVDFLKSTRPVGN